MNDNVKETVLAYVFFGVILLFSLYTGYKAESTITFLQEENYRIKAENTYLKNYIIDNDMNYTEENVK